MLGVSKGSGVFRAYPVLRSTVTRRRQDTATGKINRQTVYVITSLTSADATVQDLGRLVLEH